MQGKCCFAGCFRAENSHTLPLGTPEPPKAISRDSAEVLMPSISLTCWFIFMIAPEPYCFSICAIALSRAEVFDPALTAGAVLFFAFAVFTIIFSCILLVIDFAFYPKGYAATVLCSTEYSLAPVLSTRFYKRKQNRPLSSQSQNLRIRWRFGPSFFPRRRFLSCKV